MGWEIVKTLVYGISLMRDEKDILEYQLKNCLQNKLDGLIISDIMSQDGSRDILEKWKPVFASEGVDYIVIDEKQFGYFQAIKFNGMAQLAHERVSTLHKSERRLMINAFDCDEFWICPVRPLGDFLRENPVDFWWTTMRTMICTSKDDIKETNPTKRIRYRMKSQDPRNEISPVKVIYTWGPQVWLELGAHRTRMADMDTMREDGGRRGKVNHHIAAKESEIVFRHYAVRSVEQYISKVRNNAAAMQANPDMLKSSANRHSVERGKLTDDQLKADFLKSHFEDNIKNLKYDPWEITL